MKDFSLELEDLRAARIVELEKQVSKASFLYAKIEGKIMAYEDITSEYRKKLESGDVLESMRSYYEGKLERYEYALELLKEIIQD
jgi:competence protein ComGF